MQRSICTEATWYRAMTLAERSAAARFKGHPRQSEDRRNLPNRPNDDIIRRRIQQWRRLPAFSDDTVFRRRLATDNIDDEEFQCLIGESAEAVKSRFDKIPPWMEQLAVAFAFVQNQSSGLPPIPEERHDPRTATIPVPVDHLIRFWTVQLRDGIDVLRRENHDLPFNPDSIERILLPDIRSRLSALLAPTLALEVNVARLEGRLKGATAGERFQEYLDSLKDPADFLEMLREYPILARQLVMMIDYWTRSSLEMLQRLTADWENIKVAYCFGQDPGELTELESGAGDRHRRGRSVSILKFTSGFQIVYKPRSVAVDVHFQDLLAWFNRRVERLQFRTLTILDRASYGWVEFVGAQGCTQIEEIQRFYERQGSYLAILYILNAKDIYCENLIAAGEHPVVIDLESLFHPRIGQVDRQHAEQIADSFLAESVLGIGLLPRRIWASEQHPGIDLSGLGASAGQVMPHSTAIWEGMGTDQMRLLHKCALYPGARNRPSLNGTEVDLLAYVGYILEGFHRTYRLLAKYRADLLSGGGPIAKFGHDEVRIILRDTRAYSSLLQSSFHPDVLRSALDRDRLFDILWMNPRNEPSLEQVMSAERDDLWNGDIPVFTTRPETRNIRTSSNVEITDFLDEPSLSLVQRRLLELSEDDLEKQIWIIKASVAISATVGN